MDSLIVLCFNICILKLACVQWNLLLRSMLFSRRKINCNMFINWCINYWHVRLGSYICNLFLLLWCNILMFIRGIHDTMFVDFMLTMLTFILWYNILMFMHDTMFVGFMHVISYATSPLTSREGIRIVLTSDGSNNRNRNRG